MTESTSAAPPFGIHYIKSAGYREVSCDGVMGGPTPQAKLWMGFYTERFPIPRITYHTLKPEPGGAFTVDDSTIPVGVETREGVVRNIEVGTYMDLAVAQRLHAWLGDRIKDLEAAHRLKQAIS